MKKIFHTCLLLLLIGGAVRVPGALAHEPKVIRFAFQDRIGSVLPIMAIAKGFFAKAGLLVKPLRFSNGPACAEALYSGAADIGCMGDTTAVIMVSRRPEFAIIASHASGEHRHRIMVRNDSPIRTIEDLRGKRLGVKMGTSTYGGLLAALARHDMGVQDIHVFDLPPGTMLEAILVGAIDAFAASEPTPSVAEEKSARTLCTLGSLGNTYPVLVLANRTRFAVGGETLSKFLQAMRQTAKYVQTHPDETIDILSRITGLPRERTKRAMGLHTYAVELDQAIVKSLDQTACFLETQRIIKTTPDWAQAIMPQYIQASQALPDQQAELETHTLDSPGQIAPTVDHAGRLPDGR